MMFKLLYWTQVYDLTSYKFLKFLNWTRFMRVTNDHLTSLFFFKLMFSVFFFLVWPFFLPNFPSIKLTSSCLIIKIGFQVWFFLIHCWFFLKYLITNLINNLDVEFFLTNHFFILKTLFGPLVQFQPFSNEYHKLV